VTPKYKVGDRFWCRREGWSIVEVPAPPIGIPIYGCFCITGKTEVIYWIQETSIERLMTREEMVAEILRGK